MSSPLESIFITSLTAAPCQKSCTLRFAAVFFKEKNWFEFKSKSNPNSIDYNYKSKANNKK